MYERVGSWAAKPRVKRNHVGGNMTTKSNSDATFLPHWKVGLYFGDTRLIFILSSQHSPVSTPPYPLYYCLPNFLLFPVAEAFFRFFCVIDSILCISSDISTVFAWRTPGWSLHFRQETVPYMNLHHVRVFFFHFLQTFCFGLNSFWLFSKSVLFMVLD